MNTPEQHPGPSASKEPLFVPNQTKRSFKERPFAQRLIYYSRIPLKTTVGRIVFAIALIGGTVNGGTYYFKGPEHPLNVFNWNKMKSQGKLTPEMLEKERILNLYFDRGMTPPTTPFQGPRLF